MIDRIVKDIENGKHNKQLINHAKGEIFIHTILCFFGVHDYSEDKVLSYIQSKIDSKNIKTLSCFYCHNRLNVK